MFICTIIKKGDIMRKRKTEKKYIIIVILFVIAVFFVSLSFVFRENRNLTIFEKSIKDSGLFITRIVLSPIHFIQDKIDYIKNTSNLYEENKKLKETIKEYDALKAKYDESLKEIDDFKKTLKLNKTLSEQSYLNATVINRNVDFWYQSMTVDKGSKNGVKQGMAVVTSDGLIGKVEKTTNFNSTVKLITANDTNNKVSVKIKTKGKYVYGLMSGYDSKKGYFIVDGISDKIEIEKNSVVTTTGLASTFPSGIILGKVDSISSDNFDLAKTVNVKSAVDFSGISYVTILKRGD